MIPIELVQLGLPTSIALAFAFVLVVSAICHPVFYWRLSMLTPAAVILFILLQNSEIALIQNFVYAVRAFLKVSAMTIATLFLATVYIRFFHEEDFYRIRQWLEER